MGFRRGAAAAEEADKKNASGGSFAKADYLKIEDGDSEVVRFLWDYTEWLVIGEHSFIPTRDPKGHGLPQKTLDSWPPKTNATCRYDPGFTDEQGKKQFTDCFICDHMQNDKGKKQKPKQRIYSLVAMRDPVVGTKEMFDAGDIRERQIGKTVAYDDRYKEVPVLDDDRKPTEQMRWVLDIQIACFGWNNFYQALQVAAQSLDDTVLDRDFMISRRGQMLETRYSPTPLSPMYFSGFDEDNPESEDRIFTVQDEDVLAHYMADVDFDVEKMVADRASDEHYARFFDTSQTLTLREWEKNEGDAKPAASKSAGRPPGRPMRSAPAAATENEEDAEQVDSEPAAGGGDEARFQQMGSRLRNAGKRDEQTADA